VSLDLTAGANVLIVAVVESFGGWGLAARVEPAASVIIE
jgi:hypothetical protein